MSIRKRGDRWTVKIYDPSVKGNQRWVGTFASLEAAEEAQGYISKLPPRQCPGCRKRFKPIDEWQRRCSTRCDELIKQRKRRSANVPNDHWVYTALNERMEVLYVGLTSTGIRRAREHGRRAEWWPQVAFLKVDHYGTREEAEAAEKAAILLHTPSHNTIVPTLDGSQAA